MDKVDSILVDGDQQNLGVVGFCCLLSAHTQIGDIECMNIISLPTIHRDIYV